MSPPVDELVKSFRDFIGRDLIYIVTGGQVVGTFLYCFESVPAASDSWVLFVLLAGAGYFVAYATQELLSMLRVLPTVPVREPWGILRWVYKRYSHEAWKSIDKDISCYEQRSITAPARQSELERLVLLQQVGTAGGPCSVLCGILFHVAFQASHRPLDRYVSAAGIVFGLLLILLAWVKAAQRAQFIARYCADEQHAKD